MEINLNQTRQVKPSPLDSSNKNIRVTKKDHDPEVHQDMINVAHLTEEIVMGGGQGHVAEKGTGVGDQGRVVKKDAEGHQGRVVQIDEVGIAPLQGSTEDHHLLDTG